MDNSTEVIEVIADTTRLVEARLDAAVLDLQSMATHSGTRGIMVTRLNPGHYIVALSDGVPFGQTHERHR
ncbi:hypothetical protein [Arthrobacter sp. C9C5]|uniref:hypothetical protein n=1 Tax=Arthrobacter sp. C9C5 TaxID=2735267 RepID=UPI001585C19B|nr:hypothetical protein [Arthrobacter sp. C9C5]NUU30484.1 hypothetical protein [Arthrobacter sp. C9C5]